MKISRHTRAAVLTLLAATHAAANPAGGQVAAGSASITHKPGVTTINQSSARAVIDWQSFSIGAGETTRFVQPSANAATLNRVLGGNPSAIHGNLQANGQVFLINPNGVLVGPGGVIQTRGFTASTQALSDDAFMQGGDLRFSGASDASIVNQGVIEAAGGDIVLIARRVENTGTLRADGTAALAAGYDVLLSPSGSERVLIQPSALQNLPAASVESGGAVTAARAELKAAGDDPLALAVNLTGLIKAGSATLDATGGVSEISGQIDASGPTGGRIEVLGAGIHLKPTARLDASGAQGAGGEILVGGDYQGANDSVRNAALTLVESGARLSADAGVAGDGGRVIVWADDTTAFSGTISARGGAASGDGGFAEVSGKKTLVYRGTTDLTATRGDTGLLFLDPGDIIIGNAPTNDVSINTLLGIYTIATSGTATINANDLVAALATSNVGIYTTGTNISGGNGDIFINAPIVLPSNGNTGLFIEAARDLFVNADIILPSDLTATGLGSRITLIGLRDTTVGAHLLANTVRVVSGRNTTIADGASLTATNQITVQAFVNTPADPGVLSIGAATVDAPFVELYAASAGAFDIDAATFANANPGTVTAPAPDLTGPAVNRTGLFVFASSGGGSSGGDPSDGSVPGTNGQTPEQATSKPKKLPVEEILRDNLYLQNNPDALNDEQLAKILKNIEMHEQYLALFPNDKEALATLNLLYVQRRERIQQLEFTDAIFDAFLALYETMKGNNSTSRITPSFDGVMMFFSPGSDYDRDSLIIQASRGDLGTLRLIAESVVTKGQLYATDGLLGMIVTDAWKKIDEIPVRRAAFQRQLDAQLAQRDQEMRQAYAVFEKELVDQKKTGTPLGTLFINADGDSPAQQAYNAAVKKRDDQIAANRAAAEEFERTLARDNAVYLESLGEVAKFRAELDRLKKLL